MDELFIVLGSRHGYSKNIYGIYDNLIKVKLRIKELYEAEGDECDYSFYFERITKNESLFIEL